MDDVELRVPLDLVRTLGGTLRDADLKVTAVLCDDLLARRRARRHDGAHVRARVRPRHDDGRREPARPRDGPAAGGALAAQQAAAVRRRRHLPRLGDDARRRRARRAPGTRPRDARASSRRRCARRPGCRAAEVYEVVVAGNETMLQLALGIDPEPLSMAPFTIAARALPPATAADFGVRVHPRAPAVTFPALGAYVGADIVAGVLATGLTLDRRIRLFVDVGHELARSCSARRRARWRRPRPPGPPSRPRRSAAGCAPRRARSRA